VKVGDLVKIEHESFTEPVYGILTQYYEEGWWQALLRWRAEEGWSMSTAQERWMEVISHATK